MSRTDKDRPYWVELNDAAEWETRKVHRHELFGKPVYAWVWETDEQGNQIWYPYLVQKVPPLRKYLMKDGSTVITQTQYIFATFSPAEMEEVESWVNVPAKYETRWRRKRVRRLIGHHSMTCTIDEKETPSGVVAPCYRRMPHYRAWRKYNCPGVEWKKYHHGSARKLENSSLRSAAKQYNAGCDLTEDDYYENRALTRGRRHLGWWD